MKYFDTFSSSSPIPKLALVLSRPFRLQIAPSRTKVKKTTICHSMYMHISISSDSVIFPLARTESWWTTTMSGSIWSQPTLFFTISSKLQQRPEGMRWEFGLMPLLSPIDPVVPWKGKYLRYLSNYRLSPSNPIDFVTESFFFLFSC